MGAETYIYDRSIDRLRELEHPDQLPLLDVSSPRRSRSSSMLPEVDLVIGAVLVHGAKAPHVITRAQLELMKPHAVLVDVSIDQGGCFETSHATTHTDPTYEVDGITHYCVANMPGAVPITSTFALTNATMPYVVKLADQGVAGGAGGRPGVHARAERRRRPGHLRAGGPRPGPGVHAPEEALAARARRRLGMRSPRRPRPPRQAAPGRRRASLACVAPARSGYAPRADRRNGQGGAAWHLRGRARVLRRRPPTAGGGGCRRATSRRSSRSSRR